MRITLTTISGPASARKIWLVPGQSLTVGRTEAADFALAEDGQMSGTHFAIEFQKSTCRIRDLDSSNGTHVNGQTVASAELQDGDRILAGQTTFAVQLHGGQLEDVEGHSTRPDQMDQERLADAAPTEKPAGPQSGSASNVAATTLIPEVPIHPESRAAPRQHFRSPQIGQVRLEIKSLEASRRIWLRPGQKVTFGRTELADHAVPDDKKMSSVHFSLECNRMGCRMRNLSSSSGTLVNGERIDASNVRNGDQLAAGQTIFVVTIEYANHDESTSANFPTYTRHECPSGAILYLCERDQSSPVTFVDTLAQTAPFHLIIDYNKLETRPPFKANYLLDWVPRSMAANMSPIFLSPCDHDDMLSIVEQCWGKDALVSVFSKSETQELLNHLRTASRGQHRPTAVPVPVHMLGSCHPSQLGEQLATCSPAFASFLLSRVDAFVFESKSPQGWTVLADGRFEATLADLGLSRAAEGEVDARARYSQLGFPKPSVL